MEDFMVKERVDAIIAEYVGKRKKGLSDVIIETKDEKGLRAHKVVLAMASQALKDMLLASDGDSIFVPGNADVVQKLLKFIYTGTVDVTKVCNYCKAIFWHERSAFQWSALGWSIAGNDVVATIFIHIFFFFPIFFSPVFFSVATFSHRRSARIKKLI